MKRFVGAINLQLLVVVDLLVTSGASGNGEFVWKTGQWSGCPTPSESLDVLCGPSGTEIRSVTCIHLPTSGTVDDRHCLHGAGSEAQSPPPPASRDCFHVCPHHRHAYRWEVSEWTPCTSTSTCQQGLQPGVQRRNVTCLATCGGRGSGDPASQQQRQLNGRTQNISSATLASSVDACSHFYPIPATEKSCILPCRRDCVTTDFGPEVTGDCDSCWSAVRVRYRTVLLPAQDGGSECSDLTNVRPCPDREECRTFRHSNYRYRVGRWGDCAAFHPSQPLAGTLSSSTGVATGDGGLSGRGGFTSIIGQRRRTIDCIDTSGSIAERSFCSHHKKPTTASLCVLRRPHLSRVASTQSARRGYDNDNDDDVSSTQWTTIDDSTFQTRDLKSDTSLSERSAQRRGDLGQTSDEKDCKSYKWLVGEWGECILQQATDRCGTGLQNRSVICVTVDGQTPQPDYRCHGAGEPDEHTRTCLVRCEVSCLVSEWSMWSECLPDGCRQEKSKSKDGYRARSRALLRDSIHDDSQCPHLHEHRPCDFPLCYTWKVTPAGECRLKYPDMQCGEGRRNLTAECVGIKGGVVTSRLCIDPTPQKDEVCKVACANDCITSEWSAWSGCSRTCSVGRVVGHRARFRDILANAGHDGTPCPPMRLLIEKERCADVPCYAQYWHPGPWSQCQPIETQHQRQNDVTMVTSRGAATRCGNGNQHREVNCFKTSGEKLPSKKCVSEHAPPSSRNCTVPCPMSCVVSAFSDWSPCSMTCLSDDLDLVPVQRRARFILVYPTMSVPGSEPCPELSESRPCVNLARCRLYRWQTSEWSQCMFHSHQDHCGTGYRAREVRCFSDKDEQVADALCADQRGTHIPQPTQPCTVPCDQDACKFSAWTDWNACSSRCGGYQTRARSMEGKTGRLAECYDRIKYPVEDQRACPCPAHTVRLIGVWSHCRLDAGLTPSDIDLTERSIGQLRAGRGYCGVGRRSHALVCTGPDGRNVSALVCATSELMEEMCFVPCPRDCQMSPWTSWTPCRTDTRCGNGVQTRSRYVIEPSLDGGRDCPSLIDGEEHQKIPCHVSCDQFHWRTEEWNVCAVTGTLANSGQECGSGMQSRVIRCMRDTDGEEPEEVDETRCDILFRPFEINYCQLPCPGQCVVTNWSPWSNCTQGCTDHTRRRRVRLIVRHPARLSRLPTPNESAAASYDIIGGEPGEFGLDSSRIHRSAAAVETGLRPTNTANSTGKVEVALASPSAPSLAGNPVMCPHLEEFERCGSVSLHCRTYSWSLTTWSPCLLPDSMPSSAVATSSVANGARSSSTDGNVDRVACGTGRRVRYVECRRSDVDVAAEELCVNQLGPLTVATEEPCRVDCPVDCVVSDWSTWSECSLSCGLGLQTRSRTVVIHPQHNGRSCPEPLTQIKYCPFKECFRWRLSDWQKCQTEAGGCGYGVQVRNVSCLRHDDVIVDNAFCSVAAAISIVLTQPCFISCPGDCLVSDWSAWGPCHWPCEPQTSSEDGIPCPDDVIQTRRCLPNANCPKYAWHASYWLARGGGGNTRHVTCQRSDGLVVYGACSEEDRPVEAIRQGDCPTHCPSIEHAICHGGECICERGYKGTYAAGRLHQCNVDDDFNVNEQSTSDVTWIFIVCVTSLVAVVIFLLAVCLCHWRHSNRNEPRMNKCTSDVATPSTVNCRECGGGAVVVTVKANGQHTAGHNNTFCSLPRQPANSHFNYVTSTDVARQTMVTLNGTCTSTSRLQHVGTDYWQ